MWEAADILIIIVSHLLIFLSLKATGKIVDATQEMIALGMCNVLGSFFKSIPTCGAFTRSAVSSSSGVRTNFAGIYSAIMALMALTFFSQNFNFIPKATLAAVLICAVLSLVIIFNYECEFIKNLFDVIYCRLTSELAQNYGIKVKLIFYRGLDA